MTGNTRISSSKPLQLTFADPMMTWANINLCYCEVNHSLVQSALSLCKREFFSSVCESLHSIDSDIVFAHTTLQRSQNLDARSLLRPSHHLHAVLFFKKKKFIFVLLPLSPPPLVWCSNGYVRSWEATRACCFLVELHYQPPHSASWTSACAALWARATAWRRPVELAPSVRVSVVRVDLWDITKGANGRIKNMICSYLPI